MSQVKLPVPGASGGVTEEALAVEALGPHHYRLLNSPLWVEGLAAEDEFELTGEDPRGFRLLKKGGNLCLWLRVPEPSPRSELVVAALEGGLEWLGGRLDGGAGTAFVFTVAASVGMERLTQAFEAAVARVPGSSWKVANA